MRLKILHVDDDDDGRWWNGYGSRLRKTENPKLPRCGDNFETFLVWSKNEFHNIEINLMRSTILVVSFWWGTWYILWCFKTFLFVIVIVNQVSLVVYWCGNEEEFPQTNTQTVRAKSLVGVSGFPSSTADTLRTWKTFCNSGYTLVLAHLTHTHFFTPKRVEVGNLQVHYRCPLQ